MTRRRRRSKRRLFKRINKRDVIHAHTYHNTVLMGKQREISFFKNVHPIIFYRTTDRSVRLLGETYSISSNCPLILNARLTSDTRKAVSATAPAFEEFHFAMNLALAPANFPTDALLSDTLLLFSFLTKIYPVLSY